MVDEVRHTAYACKRCKTRFRMEWDSDEQPPLYMRCPNCGSQNAQRMGKPTKARQQLTPEQMLAALKHAQEQGGPTLDGDTWPINVRSFFGSGDSRNEPAADTAHPPQENQSQGNS